MSKTLRLTGEHDDLGTIVYAVGVDDETGERVGFYGDHRPTLEALRARLGGDEVYVEVPAWAQVGYQGKEVAP